MENKTSILKYSVNPGLILGIVQILLAVIIYVIGIDQVENSWVGYFSFAAMMAVIYIYQKDYRDNQNSGFLSLGEAVKLGITISVIGAIIHALYSIIFVTMIEPEFVEDMLLKIEEKMVSESPELTDAQIDMAIGFTRKMMSPAFTIPMAIIGSAIGGMILSLITGLFLKKSDAPL